MANVFTKLTGKVASIVVGKENGRRIAASLDVVIDSTVDVAVVATEEVAKASTVVPQIITGTADVVRASAKGLNEGFKEVTQTSNVLEAIEAASKGLVVELVETFKDEEPETK